jgi:putative transcriptional regulator
MVQKWEAGKKRPSGMALKPPAVVTKHGLKVLAEVGTSPTSIGAA